MQHPHPDWPKTLEEFRAWHPRQPDVWEFIHGVPKLMAPGSKAHTLIKGNAHIALAQACAAPAAARWSTARSSKSRAGP